MHGANIFSKKNFHLLGLCVVLLTVGYILLGQGPVDNHLSRSVAPLVLVVAYCVLVPYAILAKPKQGNRDHTGKEQGV
jgi:hypothetical protein